ncbi:uncharacterized protein LOC129751604 [Uranotaenia lowii]|uniref:uncharacterized protein LOC129751604 n=1 Tax=Uranotaenia lowii TaxID=190385 RepID=UPI0024794479|nr:uncharacterized protein LOC129751604 [Uranotaenia lowii]
MKIITIFLILCYLACFVNGAVRVIGSQVYFEKVAKRVVEILETRFITGSDLPIDSYTASINITSQGIRLDGDVSFHSAFVARIGEIQLSTQRFREILLDSEVRFESEMLWLNVAVVLDFTADLEGWQGSGTVLVTFAQLQFPIVTKREFASGEVSGSLTFMSISNQNDITIVGHPNNAHVQMIARAINTNFDFRNHMLEPFRRWNFQNILNVVLAEIPFPEVCYNC